VAVLLDNAAETVYNTAEYIALQIVLLFDSIRLFVSWDGGIAGQ